jgi:hypothetical protein
MSNQRVNESIVTNTGRCYFTGSSIYPPYSEFTRIGVDIKLRDFCMRELGQSSTSCSQNNNNDNINNNNNNNNDNFVLDNLLNNNVEESNSNIINNTNNTEELIDHNDSNIAINNNNNNKNNNDDNDNFVLVDNLLNNNVEESNSNIINNANNTNIAINNEDTRNVDNLILTSNFGFGNWSSINCCFNSSLQILLRLINKDKIRNIINSYDPEIDFIDDKEVKKNRMAIELLALLENIENSYETLDATNLKQV